VPVLMGRAGVTEYPVEQQDKRNNVITWGKDNLYPQWLNSLFYSSPIHSGIIRSKVFYTVSGGLTYDGADQVAWEEFFKNGTAQGNLDDLTEELSMDLEIGNSIAIRGRWDLKKDKCERLDIIPFETARKAIDGGDLVVSPDWSDNRQEVTTYKPLDLKNKDSFQFYVIWEAPTKQTLFPGARKIESGEYPFPPYIGAIKSIQTDAEIINFQHREIINNFAMGTIVNMNNGKPPEDEDRRKIERKFRDQSGSDGAGGTLLFYNNGKDNAITVERLNGNDLNARYLSLGSDNRKNILVGHSVTSSTLFGLPSDGNFNASEMEIGFEIMNNSYFKRRRSAILSLLMEIGTKCNGLQGQIGFNPIVLPGAIVVDEGNEIADALSKLSPVLANACISKLTDNEVRAVAKAGPIPVGDAVKDVNVVHKCGEHRANLSDEEKEQGKRFVEEFKKVGTQREGLRILHSSSVDVNDIELSREKLTEEFRKQHFEIESAILMNILSMIADGNEFNDITKALRINPADLASNYQNLTSGGYLAEDGTITEQGLIEVALNDASKLSILYSYELRPEVPGPEAIPTSRDFCVELLQLNRVYTREEIDQISTIEGRNVWTFRGGWMTIKGTDTHIPFCRHEWRQNLVYL